jgi:hypothetical protein
VSSLAALLAGAIAMGFAIAGLFFLRYWRSTRDSLFLIFAIAFWLFAANQALTGAYSGSAESTFAFYSLRLVGFLLIAAAIVLKNLTTRK